MASDDSRTTGSESENGEATETGETTETAETAETDVEEDQQSSPLPETIHGRSLVGAVLMGVLVAVMWVGGSLRGPTGILAGLLFPLYFLVGTYRPWRERIPYYDQLLAVPLLVYGLSLVATGGPSFLGVLFVVLGALGVGLVIREWYVDTDVPDPE
jgi:hypothetical protein